MQLTTPPWSDIVPTGLPPAGPSEPTRLLVLGYGNTLFSDDGIGPHIAEQVSDWNLPGVRTLAVPMLTPDLAALVAAVELVVFVDAGLAAPEHPKLQPLSPAASSAALGHATTPEALLALAQSIFGQCPPAWMLSVPARDFSLGQGFSPQTQQGAERALCQLRHLSQGLAGRTDLART